MWRRSDIPYSSLALVYVVYIDLEQPSICIEMEKTLLVKAHKDMESLGLVWV